MLLPRQKKTNRSDGRYQIVRVVGHAPDGTPKKKSFYGATKADALAKYQEYRLELTRKAEERLHTPFAKWAEEWLETYKRPDVKPSTFNTTYDRPCRNYIIPYFGEMYLQDITPVMIKAYTNTLTSLSQSTIDKITLCLKGIFETAIDNDLLSRNPCRNIVCKSKKEQAQKRVYDAESVEYLCSSDHKYALLVNILLRMGLRCSEMCGLRWEDIDFAEKKLTVKQALTWDGGKIQIGAPKSKTSTRRLPIPDDLLEKMRNQAGTGYIAMTGENHIIPNHFGGSMLKSFYRYMNVPEDERLSPHELRHTCGTLLYEQTRDIYYVSRFLGHSDVGITTRIYVHSEMQQEKVHITRT